MEDLLPDPTDMAMLMALSPADRLGGIIRLNKARRYRNRLNAVVVLSVLNERNLHRLCDPQKPEPSDSSLGIPGLSECSRARV